MRLTLSTKTLVRVRRASCFADCSPTASLFYAHVTSSAGTDRKTKLKHKTPPTHTQKASAAFLVAHPRLLSSTRTWHSQAKPGAQNTISRNKTPKQNAQLLRRLLHHCFSLLRARKRRANAGRQNQHQNKSRSHTPQRHATFIRRPPPLPQHGGPAPTSETT